MARELTARNDRRGFDAFAPREIAARLAAAGVALPVLAAGRAAMNEGALGHAVVVAGNIVGGSVLVALVYWLIYLRRGAAPR